MSQVDQFEPPSALLSVHRVPIDRDDAWPRLTAVHPINRRVDVVVATRNAAETMRQMTAAAAAAGMTNGVAIKTDRAMLEDLLSEAILSAARTQGLVVTSTTRIDTHDAFVLIGTRLILSLTKDSYERAGLTGKPSRFQQRQRYIVEVDIGDGKFKPSGKLFERLKWSFTHALTDPFPAIAFAPQLPAQFAWPSRWAAAPIAPLQQSAQLSVAPPVLSLSDATAERIIEVHEWLGLVACDAVTPAVSQPSMQSFISSYETYDVDTSSQVVCTRLTGLFASSAVARLLAALREIACVWSGVTVWGVADAPIAWKTLEHGHFMSGQTSYSVIMAPESAMPVVIQAAEAHDEFPPLR